MIISVILNILDAIEETFNEANKELTISKKICNMIFSPIWPIYTLVLMSWAQFRSKTDDGKEEKHKEELKRLTKISNHAHLIEVCTESSLQPLVQFFIIFLALIGRNVTSDAKNEVTSFYNATLAKDWSKFGEILEESTVTLQFWSFISSVVSIAWSFQSNYARKKFGQMTITSRLVYFLYVLSAVLSRIMIIILFLLSMQSVEETKSRHENFLGMYIVIGIHMAISIVLDLWLNWKIYMNKKMFWFWKFRNCILKAFSSIYIYHPTGDGESENIMMHISIDFLIFIQYLIFTGVIGLTNLLGVVWGIYLCALALKIVFYFGLHPWAEVLRKEFGSIKKSIKEPMIGAVNVPRKSKCFPFCYRLDEALMYEWTICNYGATFMDREKGIT